MAMLNNQRVSNPRKDVKKCFPDGEIVDIHQKKIQVSPGTLRQHFFWIYSLQPIDE
jgi:hypothetical protein